MYLLGKFEKLQVGALILGRCKGADQLAQPRAIDVVYFAQIKQDAPLSFSDQIANGVAQLHAALTQCDPPAEIQNSYAIYFTGSYCKCHGRFLLLDTSVIASLRLPALRKNPRQARWRRRMKICPFFPPPPRY
ncbi:hypothetical protein SBA5_150034 [Candidatus Sulfotelmatomonas gaucii]|uniref:Uncharacterized protein n=1 Tax=Candidatus Sulfuritelmatomonas gaucii TaxID=2043161 RepID=A0A2N9L4Y3_9BACT|nr:hypothetical protein SBA5_150034 [Candidatus Sulfotelmatomonas gaucii]